MTEEMLPKKYVAFSEDALSEQIGKLTEIVRQQANAIHNLSTSIAHLSSERHGGDSTAGHHGINGHASHSTQQNSNSKRQRSETAQQRIASFNAAQAKRQTASTPQQSTPHLPKRRRPSSQVALSAASARGGEEATNSLEETVDETFHAPVVAYDFDEDKAQNAKNTLLAQLVALAETTSFQERIGVVRARLCQEWLAVRPEELLARLRLTGAEVGTRKDFMKSVMDIGPGIVRGRSVKFGRDTRRALAIPRMHFTPEELDIIDKGYLRSSGGGPSGQHLEEEEMEDDGGVNED